MMRKVQVVTLALLLAAFLAPRFPDGFATSEESAGVFGPVRSIRTERARYVFKDGKWVEGPRALGSVLEVDPARRRITVTRILSDGTAADRTVFELDASGRTIRKTKIAKDGKVYLVLTCEYDRNGRLAVRTVSHPLEDRSARAVYARSADGAVQSTAWFLNPPAEGVKTAYSYDRAGREAGRTTYDPKGSITDRVFIRYDRDGSRSETWQEYFDGRVEATLRFDFDARGNLTLQSFAPGEEERFSYELDAYGNPTTTTTTMCNLMLGIRGRCRTESVDYNTITYYAENK